jgi:ribosomal small subunit protein bTHX
LGREINLAISHFSLYQFLLTLGKGAIKSKKGKLTNGSFGIRRKRKTKAEPNAPKAAPKQ